MQNHLRSGRRPFSARRMVSRLGFTVTEVITVIAITSLLLALVLPAVSNARRASRAVQCRNNFRQIGVALQDFVGVHGHFPILPDKIAEASAFLQILPNLGDANLFQAIAASPLRTRDRDLMKKRPAVYACPEDGYAVGDPLTTSYATNEGWIPVPDYTPPKKFMPRNGVMFQGGRHHGAPIRPQFITDGLSNTAAVGEIVPTPYQDFNSASTMHFQTDVTQFHSAEQIRAACNGSGSILGHRRGFSWTWFQPYATGYNHIQQPNQRVCNFALTSQSKHSGGTHLGFCDGSVRFFSDQIDYRVWQALGSRNGGEVEP